jgi:hypothetical protein
LDGDYFVFQKRLQVCQKVGGEPRCVASKGPLIGRGPVLHGSRRSEIRQIYRFAADSGKVGLEGTGDLTQNTRGHGHEVLDAATGRADLEEHGGLGH